MSASPTTPDADRVEALLAAMTLPEKIGQMTQPEKNSVTPDEVRRLGIGSVLSGGGGNPEPNTPAAWREMVLGFRRAASESRLGIPLLYGVDAVHGHNNVVGATVFPHNIGLGAAGDADLVRRIGRATAREVAATGVRWTFAPAVSVPVDVRWGRTYEGYGQDADLVGRLAAALVEGLLGDDEAAFDAVLPSVKHFVADGAARYGTSTRIDREALSRLTEDRTLALAHVDDGFMASLEHGAWTIDQGDARMDEGQLRDVFLAPYRQALAAGARNVMVSFSSWNGQRMHGHRYLITDVLKGELGFDGFVVSDWAGIDQLDDAFAVCVERAINAGIDMVMVPFDHRRFMDTLARAVASGAVPVARIDDAVRRILRTKASLGLFTASGDADRVPDLALVGHAEHRRLAEEAVRRSLVLLHDRRAALPLGADLARLLVVGAAADDVGLQCGGWTVTWMGAAGDITPGSTLLDGLRARRPATEIVFDPDGRGDERAPVGIVVVAEEPYAEGMGDRHDLELAAADHDLIARVRERVDTLVLVVYSGRPLVLGRALELADAVVAAWLPGSEGAAVADPLLGVSGFEGTLRFRWPATSADLPVHPFGRDGAHGVARFEIGHGLRTRASSTRDRVEAS